MNTPANIPSPIQEEDTVTLSQRMGASALQALGLSPLDNTPSSDVAALASLLGKLDKRKPELGIKAEVATALKSDAPFTSIKALMEKHREALASMS